MPDYIAPSKKFSRTQATVELPDFYRPNTPALFDGGVPLTPADNQISYAIPKPSATRPGSIKAPGATESYASVGLAGLQNSQVPASTDAIGNVASVAGNTLSGAASGALAGATIGAAGGPIGAIGGAAIGGGIALVTSGLNAWLGNRQARAERDRQNALAAEAKKIAMQDRADLERWKQTTRSDSLEQARYERQKYAQESARQQNEKIAQQLQGILANSQNAKAAWAQFGFN